MSERGDVRFSLLFILACLYFLFGNMVYSENTLTGMLRHFSRGMGDVDSNLLFIRFDVMFGVGLDFILYRFPLLLYDLPVRYVRAGVSHHSRRTCRLSHLHPLCQSDRFDGHKTRDHAAHDN